MWSTLYIVPGEAMRTPIKPILVEPTTRFTSLCAASNGCVRKDKVELVVQIVVQYSLLAARQALDQDHRHCGLGK
jgi:hypothetical protein